MNEWNIQCRSHACQNCHRSFSDKQTYHTLLFEDKGEFKRMDICHECWEKQYSEGGNERKNFISYWQGTYETPPPAPAEPIQKESAESLLRKLMELSDPRHRDACFILAVMLERKRILKVKEQVRQDDHRLLVYEHAKTGEAFLIVDPDLQLNQLEEVQRDVAHLLETGLRPPPAPEAAASPEPAPASN